MTVMFWVDRVKIEYPSIEQNEIDMPTHANISNLQLRSQLQIALRKQITSWNVHQGEAAVRLGIGRPRLNDLLRGKIHKFSLDALINLAVLSGFGVEVSLRENQEKTLLSNQRDDQLH